MIYHITTRRDWRNALAVGEYRAASLAEEGFIHCSKLDQVLPVANSFYGGQTGLVLLAIEPERLGSPLKWETPSGGAPPPGVAEGDEFPHIYGPINLDAVVKVADLRREGDEGFRLPEL